MDWNKPITESQAISSLNIVFASILAATVIMVCASTYYRPVDVNALVVTDARLVSGIVNPEVIISEPLPDLEVANLDPNDVECLALNIYHEARGETLEGQVAVGIVTLNRANDNRWPDEICNVVQQTGKVTKKDDVGNVVSVKTVCQFGWYCDDKIRTSPKKDGWTRSKQIAEKLLVRSDYDQWFDRYEGALYFHGTKETPSWRKVKNPVKTTGGHIFYADR